MLIVNSLLDDLPIRIFVHDPIAAERPEVASPHDERRAVDGGASERPRGGAALPGDKIAVTLVADVGNTREARSETLADCLLALETATPGLGAARRVEGAVVSEQGHDRVEVVLVEGVEHAA